MTGTSRFAISTIAVSAAALAVLAAQPASAQVPDHFTCYKARTTSGAPKFVPRPNVSLVDALRSSTVEVKKPKLLCAPTNKNNEDPSAPSHLDHLEDYLIKPTVKFVKVTNQRIVDQYGTLFVDLKKPVALQVPTRKQPGGPTPPTPTNPAVDHFTCYKVKITSGTPKFARVGATIQDQFGTMTVEVRKPKRLCLPTNKLNEEPGAQNHPDHLLCYQVKQTSLPKFVVQPALFLNNQFGPENLDAKKPAELCVPALRNPSAQTPTPTATPTATPTTVIDCGNGTVDLPDEQCDPAAAPGPPNLCDPSQCVPAGASAGGTMDCTCATGQFRTIFDTGELDSGWTGTSHNTQTVGSTDFDSLLFDCDGVIDPVCQVAGPRPGKYGFRCELNSRVVCSTNADCAPLNGRCGGFLGAPLPLSSGGVPVCVNTFFPRPVTGTINVTDGSTETFTFLLSKVHTSPAIDAPCPRCNCTIPPCGVEPPNNIGTCSGGPAVGQACTVEGISAFGPMSRDCPPIANANVSGQGLDIRFLPTTTGTSTKTAILPCTAAGYSQYACACDTCAGGSTPNAPCASDADCPDGGVCAGLRCVGGPTPGMICTTAAQCGTGGSCTRPGLPTKPNDCEFGCAGGPTPDNPCATNADCGVGGTCVPLCRQLPGEQTGQGQCVIGPTDGKCSAEPFRGCNLDAECNSLSCIPPGGCPGCTMCGQTCVIDERPCHVFPMQLAGDPNPFVVNTSTGISVNTFCIPPTTADAVNSTAGLPGEGAIIVDHTFTKKFPADICTTTCP